MTDQQFSVVTWNLAGRWTERHRRFLEDLDCDVLLLTEVNERFELHAHRLHLGQEPMLSGRRWAAVGSRHILTPRTDPHPASAMAVIEGVTYCSSVLPWRGCAARDFWSGEKLIDKTRATASALDSALPSTELVWGGDWNHALHGPEHAGTVAGRKVIRDLVDRRGLVVPTEHLTHRIADHCSIDHIAVPREWPVIEAHRVVASDERGWLSDHDAYMITMRRTR